MPLRLKIVLQESDTKQGRTLGVKGRGRTQPGSSGGNVHRFHSKTVARTCRAFNNNGDTRII